MQCEVTVDQEVISACSYMAGVSSTSCMTVCISAMCENGAKIVSATDGLVTLGGVTADNLPGKMRWLNNWLIASAGSTGNAGLFLEELRILDEIAPDSFKREQIHAAITHAYNAFRSKQSAHSVLGPLGI